LYSGYGVVTMIFKCDKFDVNVSPMVYWPHAKDEDVSVCHAFYKRCETATPSCSVHELHQVIQAEVHCKNQGIISNFWASFDVD